MTPLVDMICIESQEPISKLHDVIRETQLLWLRKGVEGSAAVAVQVGHGLLPKMMFKNTYKTTSCSKPFEALEKSSSESFKALRQKLEA